MKWPTHKEVPEPENFSKPFLVLPLLQINAQSSPEEMTKKKPNLKLFTKTWPPRRNENRSKNKNDDRPLTATLEKPEILDIKFIGKIDMSLIRKEFLCITNLCRAPLTVSKLPKKATVSSRLRNVLNRPLSLPSSDERLSVSRRPNRPETSEDSWEDEESIASQAQSARCTKISKITGKKIAPAAHLTAKRQTMKRLDKKLTNDPNNNQKLSKIVRKKVENNNTPAEAKKAPSTKLPEPCKTCGRPDQPERFHSHPVTPLKPAKKMEEVVKIPVKSTVQKPVAIKYKSRQGDNKPAPLKKPPLPAQHLVHTPPPGGDVRGQVQGDRPRTGRGPRTLMCYLCGREFGTKSLPLHEPKCLEKWERENASLPHNLRRKLPQKPDTPMTAEKWNDYAWESCQASLLPCENCGRTFLPDRLVVHQRSCKSLHGMLAAKADAPMSLPWELSSELTAITAGCSSLWTLASPSEAQWTEAIDEKEKPINGCVKPTKQLKDLSFPQKIRFAISNITVEPMMVCFVLPNIMASLTTQNLNLEKACRVNLKLDTKICDALAERNSSGYNQSDEVAVQRLVASAYVWKNVVQSVFPVILLPFLGSWSDRYKRRKTCILLPMIGEVFTNVGFLLCTYFFYELPMEVNVATEALPTALTGGWNVMFLGAFTFVCAMSSVETRTLRIGVIHVLFNISLTVGNALSGVIYTLIGFYGVFSLALGMYILGIFYGVCMVKEDKTGRQKRSQDVGFFKDFFDLKHISNTLKVVFKPGEANRKKKVYLIMILAMLIIGPIHGEMNVLYLYTRYKLHWNEVDFSIFFTYSCVAHLLGCTFALAFFSKYLKLDDAMLGLISSVSKICGCIIYAFAPNTMMFYLGTLIEVFNGTAFIAMRSIISKLVTGDELGKMNSMFGMSEALMPLIYGPMYSALYKATIKVFPGSFFLLGGVLTIPAVLIFIWLYLHRVVDDVDEDHDRDKKLNLITNNIVIGKENKL